MRHGRHRLALAIPGIVAFALFAVGVFLSSDAGVVWLLSLAVFLAGLALLCQMIIAWGMFAVSQRLAFAGALSGLAFAAYAAYNLQTHPEPASVVNLILLALAATSIAYVGRISIVERGSSEDSPDRVDPETGGDG